MPTYLRYGTIKGEVKKPAAYRGWIELQGIQWGVGRPLSTGRSSVGSSPDVSEILVIKQFDSSSVALQQEALTGEGTVAIIDFAKADGHVDLRCTLTDAMINSYGLGEDRNKPTESLRLSFTKVDYKQTPGGPPPPP